MAKTIHIDVPLALKLTFLTTLLFPNEAAFICFYLFLDGPRPREVKGMCKATGELVIRVGPQVSWSYTWGHRLVGHMCGS